MAEPLLNPAQQRILIFVLAVMLLAVSMIGLRLCRRLGKARDRLDIRQRKDTDVLLILPDRQTKQDQPKQDQPPSRLGPTK